MITTYHPGGFDDTAPAHNRAEQWDTAAGTFTRWDTSGVEVERRAMTPDEIAAATPPPAVAVGDLAVDRYTIPADGATYAVARYGATDTVHFVVDGTVQTVTPVDGVAELEIAAAGAGPITVQVRDRSFVIVAEA